MAALLAYLAVRGGEDGPLFRFRDCRALTREVSVDKVRSALSILGYEASTYAGHSFRIGAATTAAEKGIEDSVIKMLGRWESSAYQLYVCSSREISRQYRGGWYKLANDSISQGYWCITIIAYSSLVTLCY